MTDGDGHNRAVIGGLVAGLGTLLATVLVGLFLSTLWEIRERRQYGQAHTYADCSQSNECGPQNLRAEIRSAISAEDMTDVAIWQAVLGFLGLLGVGGTVIYARAAWTTSESTLAETRTSSERQLRAYIYVSNASFRQTVEGTWVELTFQNFGQTPAHDVWVERAASVRDYPLTEALSPLARDDALFDLAPNAVAGTVTFPFAEWDDPSPCRFGSGGTALYLHGTIHYRDAFNKDRKTNFRYLVRSRSDSGVAPAGEGNTST